jgi:drug/metabolite transporter (DMT)-like permease
MSPGIVVLVLGAAVLHASWNALLRGRSDLLWSITMMSIASSLVAIPGILLLPPPAAASWPYIAVSAVLQVGYSLFLVQAYRMGEFSQVYPIARGSAPLLVTLGAAILAGERPSLVSLLGIALVCGGIISLARRGGVRMRAVVPALATGAFIASYGVCDGIGSRLSGSALAYAAWIFLLYGASLPLITLGPKRRPKAWPAPAETLKALGGGALAMLGYSTVVWAMSLSPMGPVAALRETSILFAAIIGRLFLGEKLTLRRVAACLAITIGAVCLGHG